MRKLTFSLFAPLLAACSFQAQVGNEPQHPPPHPAPAPTPAPAPAPVANAKPIRHTGHPTPQPGAAPAPTPVPANGQIVTTSTIFGSNSQDPNGYKGSVYWIPAGSTTIPNLSTMTPNGFLFNSTLNIGSQAFTTGFPGIDATHTQNFAIRYIAPLVVGTEADYDFRVNADDGAVLSIDGTTIVDDNGVHTTATSKDGPVHLVAGTHAIQVDYFQTTGNVALQVFCTKSGATEQVCPTRLP